MQERTDVTIKMANVARESAETVSDQMTAVWNNFNKAGDQSAEHFADVMTALGAATASSTDEIAEGLEKFAGIADTVGLSFDYATSALATITATSRESADVVGTALKTIFSRVEGLKLGETLDDGTDLNKYSQALATIGVSIKDANGELKDMDTILDETGEKWQNLARDQKMATAQTVAGVRQYNQFMTLMENWDFMQENLSTARGSEGTLQEQADIYAESWEAARDRVTAAAEDIYAQLLDDDFFINLNNGFAGFLDIISDTIDGIGGLQGVLSAAGFLVTKIFSEDLASNIDKFIYNLQDGEKIAMRMRDEALNSVFKMTEGSNLEAVYENIAIPQEAYLANAEQMSEVEKHTAQILLEQHATRVEDLVTLNEQVSRQQEIVETEKNKIINLARSKKANEEQLATLREDLKTYQQLAQLVPKIDQGLNKAFGKIGSQAGLAEIQKIFSDLKNSSQDLISNLSTKLKGELNVLATASTQDADRVALALERIEQALGEVDSAVGITGPYFEELNKDLQAIGLSPEQAAIAIEKVTGEIYDFGRIAEQASQQEKELSTETERLNNIFNNTKIKMDSWGTTIINLANGFSSIAMGINTFKGIIDVLNNEDMSGGEKLLSVVTSLGMTIPMVMSGMKTLLPSLGQLGVKLALLAGDAATAALGETILSATNVTLGETFGVAAAGAASLMAIIWPFVAIGAAVAVAAVAIYKAWNKDAEAAEKAAETAAELKEQYEDVKSAYEDLKSSLEDYDSAREALSELTAGTQEWKEAVIDLNSQVLELLDKYPELASSISNVNGLLTFNESGLDDLLENQLNEVQKAYQTQIMGQTAASSAQLQSDITDIRHESRMSYGGQNLGMVSESAMNRVVDALEENGNAVLDSAQSLSDAAGITIMEAKALMQDGGDALKELATEIVEDRLAREAQNQELGQSLIEGTEYAGKEYAETLAQIVGSQAQQISEDLKNNKYSTMSMTDWDAQAAYADLIGAESHKDKTGNVGEYLIDGEWQTITDDVARTALAMNDAQNQTTASLEKFNAALQFLASDSRFGKSGDKLGNMLSGNTQVENLTREDLIQLMRADYDKLTDEEREIFAQFGVTTSEELVNLQHEVNSNWEQSMKSLRDGMSYNTAKIYDELDTSKLTVSGKKAISSVLERAIEEGSEDSIADIQTMYGKALDMNKANEFANVMSSIDWGTIDAATLSQQLSDVGINADNLDVSLDNLIDSMRTAAETAAAAAERLKIADGLTNEDNAISSEEYNQLTEEQQEMFQAWWDNTYRLKVDAEDFYDIVENDAVEAFRQSVGELSDEASKLHALQDIGYDSLQSSNPPASAGGVSEVSNSMRQEAQIDYILEFSSDSSDLEEASYFLDKINDGVTLTNEESQKLADAVTNTGDHTEELNSKLESTEEQLKTVSEQAESLSQELDDDVDADEWRKLANHINKAGSAIEGLSDDVKGNRKESEKLSSALLRYDSALESVQNNMEDWEKLLASDNIQDNAQAVEELSNAYGDLLDINGSLLSESFLTSAENLDLLKQAANGSEEAYDSLMQKAQQDIETNLHLNTDEFYADKAALEAALDDFGLEDIEIGAKIDNSQAIAAMEELINDAGMTAQQATDYLSTMGVDAEVETTTVDNSDTHEYVGARAIVEHQNVTYMDPLTGEEVNSDVPSIHYNPVTTPVTVNKQDSATSLKVTSANKSSGGGFKFNNSSHGGGSAGRAARSSSGGSGKGGGGSKGSGSKGKKAKKEKKTETKKRREELDRYWQINQSIGQISTTLNKLGDEYDYVFGKGRIKNLKEQNKELQKQLKNYQSLVKEQKQERKELRKQAKKNEYDAKYDDEGMLKNYEKVVNKQINKYNKAVTKADEKLEKARKTYNESNRGKKAQKKWEEAQEAHEKAINKANKTYDKFEEWLERYQTLTQEEMVAAQEEIAEMKRQIIENNFEQFDLKFQVKIDKRDAEREWRSFIREMNRTLDDVRLEFNFTGLTKNSGVLTDITKSISSLTDNLKDNIKESTELANIYLNWGEYQKSSNLDDFLKDSVNSITEKTTAVVSSQTEALEKFRETQEEVESTFEEITELMTSAWEAYYDAIDQVTDAYDRLNTRIERMKNQLEYAKELTELIYGEEAYDKMTKYYDTQESLISDQITTQRTQQEFWKNQYETALQARAEELNITTEALERNVLYWTQDMVTYYDNMTEAEENINDLVLERIEMLKEGYFNTVNEQLQNVLKEITGYSSLDSIADSWERAKENASAYLDTTERTYNIQTLMNKYDQSIEDNSKNLQATQKLNKLREEELAYLSEKNNLTQYDIDMANARYEIALKEIALEEAQNNKNSMKLTRNAQGNWTYQYVANTDDVEKKQEELNDALFDYYEKAKDSYSNTLDEMANLQQTYFEKIQEISELALTDEAAYTAKKLELDEWYNNKSQQLAEQNILAQQDMASASTAILNLEYQTDYETFEKVNSDKKILLEDLSKVETDTFNSIRTAVTNNYEDIGNKAKEVFISDDESLSNLSTSVAQKLIDQWYDNPDSVKNRISDAYTAIEKKAEEYRDKVAAYTKDINTSYSSVKTGIDEVKTATTQLSLTSETELAKIKSAVDSITAAWNEAKAALDNYNNTEVSKVDNYNAKEDYDDETLTTADYSFSSLKEANEKLGGTTGVQGLISLAQKQMMTTGGKITNDNGTLSFSYMGKDYEINTTPYAAAALMGETTQDYYKYRAKTPLSYSDNATSRSYFEKFDDSINGVYLYGPNIGKTVLYTNVPDSLYKQVKAYKKGTQKTLSFDTGGYTGDWAGEGRMAVLHQKEMVLNKDDTKNLLSAVDVIRDLAGINDSVSSAIMSSISGMVMDTVSALQAGTIANNEKEEKEQIVIENISAEFPNAENVEEIKEAIMSLPRLASQYVSRNLK